MKICGIVWSMVWRTARRQWRRSWRCVIRHKIFIVIMEINEHISNYIYDFNYRRFEDMRVNCLKVERMRLVFSAETRDHCPLKCSCRRSRDRILNFFCPVSSYCVFYNQIRKSTNYIFTLPHSCNHSWTTFV